MKAQRPLASSLSFATTTALAGLAGLVGLGMTACHVTTYSAPPNGQTAATPAPAPAPAPDLNATTTTTTTTTPVATTTASATVAPTTTPPPADSDTAELADVTTAPESASFGIASGRSKSYTPGADEGLWIWKDAKGDGWHVRATTGHKKHRFQGRIEADGPLIGLHTTGNEGTDKLHTTPKGVWFSFATLGHEDGFDFKLPAGSCMRVLSAIDGKPRPDRVYLGSGDAHPTNGNVKLCP